MYLAAYTLAILCLCEYSSTQSRQERIIIRRVTDTDTYTDVTKKARLSPLSQDNYRRQFRYNILRKLKLRNKRVKPESLIEYHDYGYNNLKNHQYSYVNDDRSDKWNKNDLTYVILNFARGLKKKHQRYEELNLKNPNKCAYI